MSRSDLIAVLCGGEAEGGALLLGTKAGWEQHKAAPEEGQTGQREAFPYLKDGQTQELAS